MKHFRLSILAALTAASLFGCAHSQTTPETRNPASAEELEYFDIGPGDGTSVTFLQEGTTKSTANLDRCKGQATLLRLNGQLTLRITNSSCANVLTKFGQWKLNGTGNSGRYIDVKLSGEPGWHEITVGSNAFVTAKKQGKTDGNGDVFYVYVPVKMVPLELRNKAGHAVVTFKQPSNGGCGGTIEGTKQNGVVNIVVRNTHCALFDILSANGDSISYDAKPLQYNKNTRLYSAGFTLPSKYYGWWNTGIQVKVYNAYGAEERVNVTFNNN